MTAMIDPIVYLGDRPWVLGLVSRTKNGAGVLTRHRPARHSRK